MEGMGIVQASLRNIISVEKARPEGREILAMGCLQGAP